MCACVNRREEVIALTMAWYQARQSFSNVRRLAEFIVNFAFSHMLFHTQLSFATFAPSRFTSAP